MTRVSDAGPRHALDCELTPELPDERVRAAMAAFYKTSEGYAQQQGTHTRAYFGRLLNLIDVVLTMPNPHVLEIGAGASGAMRAFLSRHADARAVAMEMSSMSLRGAATESLALRGVAGDALHLPFEDPSGHISFASTHKKEVFTTMEMVYGTQVMWPDHCVQGTADGALHKDLNIPHAQLVIRKGYNANVDGYSAFLDLDGKTHTGLEGYLRGRGIKRVFLAGLATDFCVMWSATDARKLGFEAAVIEDACRHIDVGGSLAAAWKKMDAAGVKRIQSTDIA